jgi:type IV secretory pathway VirB10-like protein
MTPYRQEPPPAAGINGLAIVTVALVLLAILAFWLWLPLWTFGRSAAPATPVEAVPETSAGQVLQGLPSAYRATPEPAPRVPEAVAPAVPPESTAWLDLRARLEMLEHALARLHATPSSAPPSTPPTGNTQEDLQAEVARKRREAFVKAEPIFYARATDQKGTTFHAAASPYTLQAGHLIPCIVESGMISETPGPIKVRVRETVYDTATGVYPLIPQGTVVIGQHASRLIFGKSRIEPQFTSMTLPNGLEIQASPMPGLDVAGQAGFTGEVDRHYGRLLASIVLTGVLRGGTTALAGYGGGIPERIGGAVATETGQRGTQEVRQWIDTSPTVTIYPGMLCTLFVTKRVEFPSPYVQ